MSSTVVDEKPPFRLDSPEDEEAAADVLHELAASLSVMRQRMRDTAEAQASPICRAPKSDTLRRVLKELIPWGRNGK